MFQKLRAYLHAATLLGGQDPRELVETETNEGLHQNRIGRILCTLQALAAVGELREVIPNIFIVTGCSVGEIAAWSVANFLSMTDTLNLVISRAECMDAASPPDDGLLFVRGLSHEVVDLLCERHNAAIAIVNSGHAFVLGGSRAALNAIADEAKTMNAATVAAVPVPVASHTKRLAKARIQFRESLNHVRLLASPGVRLLSGVDGSPVTDVELGLDKLAAQISHTVHWGDCVEGCMEGGPTAFLELGPGRALSAMVAGAYHDAPTRGLDDFKTVEGARVWLTRCAR